VKELARKVQTWSRMAALAPAAEPMSSEAMSGELKSRSITVTGSGTAQGSPNQVEVNAAVVTTGERAKAAMDANSLTMTGVLANLKKAGFDDKSVATTHFNVSPRFQKRDGRTEAPVIVGYQVNSQIRVTVTDIKTVGEVLDQITAAGINQISGLRFVLTERDDLTDNALRAAMADARHKAGIVAQSAGAVLGQVLNVEERGTSVPQPRLMAFSERSTVPIVPGEQTVRASVSVTYALIGAKSD